MRLRPPCALGRSSWWLKGQTAGPAFVSRARNERQRQQGGVKMGKKRTCRRVRLCNTFTQDVAGEEQNGEG